VDYNIGRLLDALGDERDNTLIVFTCDHGEMLGDYGCVGKRCMLEAAVRIPLVLSWPGRLAQDIRCATPATLMDIYPTIMEILGVDREPRSAEGQSLLSLADGESRESLIYSQFSKGWCGQYGVTDGQWKYAYSAPDHREWLFEVSDGLEEGPNRLDEPAAAEHLSRLKPALLKRHDPSVDPYSDAVEDGDWKKHTPPPEDYLKDPTFGYLWQERAPEQLQKAVNDLGPGYARTVIKVEKVSGLHGLHGVCGGKSPFEE
jgi:choline-sulfatase